MHAEPLAYRKPSERPRKQPNTQPPNVTGLLRGNLKFLKEAGEVAVTPTPANHLTKATPKKLHESALEEDVIRVFSSLA